MSPCHGDPPARLFNNAPTRLAMGPLASSTLGSRMERAKEKAMWAKGGDGSLSWGSSCPSLQQRANTARDGTARLFDNMTPEWNAQREGHVGQGW
jgi:hypothetical protein